MGKTRVLVVLTDLHGGGAQRIVLTLLTHLPRERFDLHLALVTRTGRMLPQVPPDVPVHDLGAKRVRGAALPLVRLVRALRPDVVFSTLYHLNQMVLLLRPSLPQGTRLVIREAITVSEALRHRGPGRLSALLLRRLYPSADLIVCQCEFMADDLARHFAVPRAKMATIYNPIDVEHVRSLARAGTNPFRDRDRTRGPHLVALGRLDPQKGFDHLIRRLPVLLASRPEAHLWIVGEDGAPGRPTARALEALVRDLRLQPRVHFTGFRPNPYPYLAHADLFVLSSRYEGLPNALIEALALGCPVVALDRPGGTREILERSGLPHRLVPELDWRPEWFRGEGPDEPEPDLSTFSLERALEAYGEALGPLTPST